MAEYDPTGTGATYFAGAGPSEHDFLRTGRGITPRVGKGASVAGDHPMAGITHQWQRSTVGSGIWRDIEHETGLNYIVALGDRGCLLRVVEYDRNYLGSVSAASDATEPFFIPNLGIGEAGLTGHGADAITWSETGTGISIFTGHIGKVYEKTGSGVSPRTGKGSDAWTKTQRGTGISDRVGAGTNTWTLGKKGKGIINDFIGSGARA